MLRIGIEKFIFFLVGILIFLTIIFFINFYVNQHEKKATVILKSVKSQMAEAEYILSKGLKSKNEVGTFLPLLNRIAANNDFIAAITIHDGEKVLLSTDPLYRKVFKTAQAHIKDATAYKQLMQQVGIEDEIYFYRGDVQNILQLTFVFDKKEIKSVFSISNREQMLSEFFLIFMIILFIWFMIHRYVVKPLEKLRQFAYYQNSVPKKFLLQELEVIRYTMVETFEREEIENKELYNMARKDSLSGLANRKALLEYLEKLIDRAKHKNEEFAVLFLDLDHFKSVNDSLGHNVGDELLKQVAGIIEDVLRSNDFVARVGGDEFVIVLQEYNSILELTNVIDRIQTTLAQTRVVQSYPINTSSSVGIAFYPKDGETIVSLMKNSDIAMYEAKKKGRAQHHFFTKELNARIQDTIKLESEMKEALANSEYELYYQPKVDIKSGKIVAAEALIRWNSPTKGMISPIEFIPLAEENGFIIELGKWVFQEGVRQQVRFAKLGMDIKISINLSSKQLLASDFMDFFMTTMQDNKANPRLIDIEITEYMFYENSDKNTKVLNALHEYGVSISLDDFGTGYSSLSYLKDFPIDYLKIDKAFVDDMETERGRIFVDTIVKMGQTLKMTIITEGVEEIEQLEYLKSIGCDQYQGYYMSKPLKVDDFKKLYFENS